MHACTSPYGGVIHRDEQSLWSSMATKQRLGEKIPLPDQIARRTVVLLLWVLSRSGQRSGHQVVRRGRGDVSPAAAIRSRLLRATPPSSVGGVQTADSVAKY